MKLKRQALRSALLLISKNDEIYTIQNVQANLTNEEIIGLAAKFIGISTDELLASSYEITYWNN